MLKFKQYTNIIKENLNPTVSKILDRAKSNRLSTLIDYSIEREKRPGNKPTGFDTTLGTPSGSSRKVYFNKDRHDIKLDGIDTKVRTIHKVAMHNPRLDIDYKKYGYTMGEFQNMVEGRKSFDKYRVIKKSEHGDGYETNHEGILPPIYGRHVAGHFLHMGAIVPLKNTNLGHNLFTSATKHEKFPTGITHKEFYTALQTPRKKIKELVDKANALGMSREARGLQKQHDAYDHPLVKKVKEFSKENGIDPVDFDIHNLGLFVHPQTGKQSVVLADAGYSKNIARYYKSIRNKRNAPTEQLPEGLNNGHKSVI